MKFLLFQIVVQKKTIKGQVMMQEMFVIFTIKNLLIQYYLNLHKIEKNVKCETCQISFESWKT